MKQTDDLLHNYTVAKITCDCDFSTTKIVKQKLKVISTTDASGNTTTEIDYDANGDVQYEDDLDENGKKTKGPCYLIVPYYKDKESPPCEVMFQLRHLNRN